MTTPNEDPKATDNMESSQPETAACSPGCGCHAGEPACHLRWIAGIIIILAAGVLVTRALIKSNSAPAEKAVPGFSSVAAFRQATNPLASSAPAAPVSLALKEIGSLSELTAVAADMDGIFVFLPGIDEPLIKAPLAQMRSAAQTINSQGHRIGLFILKPGAPDYTQVAAQMTVPGVLAMVKGRGMVPVSGDITESQLIQAFVAASSDGGCGPSGCGPSGCQ